MKKIYNVLFSTRLTAVLFVVFAISMAVATFIENDYGTQTAQALVYYTWWFEVILLIFVINFIGNIQKFKLYKKDKIATLVFHLAFILIISGAAITRYISFEGIMPIFEGETTNKMLSNKAYLKVYIDDGENQKKPLYKNYLFAKNPQGKSNFITLTSKFLYALRGGNGFNISTNFKEKPVEIKYVNYIANAFEEFVPDKNGDTFIKIVESGGGQRHDHYLKKGETLNIHNSLISFEDPSNEAINLFTQNGILKIESPFQGNYMIMASKTTGNVVTDSVQDFHLRSLYQIGSMQFVIPEAPKKGFLKMSSGKKGQNVNDLLEVQVKTGGQEKNIKLLGNNSQIANPTSFSLNGLNFRLSYGAKQMQLPFSIKLKDFQLEKYPGSMSPKSYASEITVMDKDKSFDFRIFMNHVLDYKGYRFFQSSYNDRGDVEQTFLSVNHDKIGTRITYLGYGLLFLGLIVNLLLKGTRFGFLRKRLAKIKAKKAAISMILLLFTVSVFAQDQPLHNQNTDKLLDSTMVNKEEAQKFGELVIQDEGGRMKPVNTFASELLRKVSKKDTYKDYDANQVLVSMVTNPRLWYFVPFIYIKKENTKIRDLIGVPHDQKYVRFADLFTEQGAYKLREQVGKSYNKRIKNKYDQSILDVDVRANLLFGALEGNIFRFFPLPNDKNNKWYSVKSAVKSGFKGKDSLFVQKIIPMYAQAVAVAIQSNDYELANKYLDGMHKFQRKYGSAVIPSEKKIKLELFYNKYDIFKGLFWKYMLASLLMMIVVIVHIFNNSKIVKAFIKASAIIIVLLFVYHTIGLGIRWYISGHAPWSNGYESMIYVSWATMLFGLILSRKSALTLAATTFVTSMLLMVAHWNWMDPSIGNLVPVLDSYWLMVHVAIIVASYGPFTIGMILGMLALILYSVTTEKNKKKLKQAINEITIINEMSLTIGLVMLTIGNFLGGIWANESWGRYWGWDPKETWALISIMVYACVLHMRIIPGLKSRFTFNVISVFAFTSILMTYLGVNHLLSGLHSYATGESAAVPNQIWGWLGISVILSILAYLKFNKFYKKKNKES